MVTNEADVSTPTETDSAICDVFLAEKYTFDPDGFDAQFGRISRRISWNPPEITGRLKSDIPQQVRKELIDRLEGDRVIHLHEELLLQAKELGHLHRNYTLAVVVTQSAFEVFLQHRVAFECEVRNISTLPTRRGGEEKQVDYREAIESGRLSDDLLGSYCKTLAGGSVRNCQEYQEWYERAYRPRNDIVHRGLRGLDQNDWAEAFEAVVRYANYIDARLFRGR